MRALTRLLTLRVRLPAIALRPFATRAQLAASAAAAAAAAAARPTPEQFAALFARLARGLEDMAAANRGFSVAVEGTVMRITTGRAGEPDWELRGDPESGLLGYSSDKVGTGGEVLYKLGAAGAWVGVDDGHNLDELLARDLVHNRPTLGGLKGFPTF